MITLRTDKRYEILWVDTYNFLGWHFEDDIEEKTIDHEFQSSVGYFVKSTKDWYIFAMHKNPNTGLGFPKWGNVTYIPKKAVVKVQTL